MASLTKFESEQLADVKRQPKFHPDVKGCADDPEAVLPRGTNQHTATNFATSCDKTWAWLRCVASTTRYGVPDADEKEQLWECWTVDPKATQGIDETATGYPRISFRGGKVQTHVFTWCYYHPGTLPNGDVSHLCGNALCIRPSHLHDEAHDVNMSRIHCVGYIYDVRRRSHHKVCMHNPPCLRVRGVLDSAEPTEVQSDPKNFL